jgi:hypothetical protein
MPATIGKNWIAADAEFSVGAQVDIGPRRRTSRHGLAGRGSGFESSLEKQSFFACPVSRPVEIIPKPGEFA